MKCNHERENLSITQHLLASRNYAFGPNNNHGCSWEQLQGATGMITVSCEECGYQRKFNKYKAPKWVSEILIELGIIDE